MKKRDTAGNPLGPCLTSNAVGTALQNNTLRIRSTGKANGQTRSVVATFKRRSFMDFVYFTNSEAQDPLVGGGTDAQCSAKRNTPRSSACTEITFVGPDVVKGPLHTNDSSVLTSGGTISSVATARTTSSRSTARHRATSVRGRRSSRGPRSSWRVRWTRRRATAR